jgi:hypothetical protein
MTRKISRFSWRGRAATKVEPEFHHEGREEHEVPKLKMLISKFFVAFVRFVVRGYYLIDP